MKKLVLVPSLLISTLQYFVPIALAADITLGPSPITGLGKFQTDTPASQLANFISTIINVITITAGLAFLLYFAIGGLKWITSSGEKARAEEAKTELTQAAIGLIVVAVSYFIVGIVGGVVGIDILNPGKLLGIQQAPPK